MWILQTSPVVLAGMIRWPTSWGCSSLGYTWPRRNHRAVGGGLAAGQSAAPGGCWACFPVLRASSDPSALPKATISASELSLSDVRDKPTRRLDPGLMPLPDTAAGLEWSSLVNAAKAYEGRSALASAERSLPPARELRPATLEVVLLAAKPR